MAVSGPISPRRLSEAAQQALSCGDIDELIRINRAEFGGLVMMASDDDQSDDVDDDDDDDDASGDDDDNDGKKKSKKSQKDDDDEDDDDDGETPRERRLRKRMQAADRRRSEAEAELQKIKDAEKTDLERAQGQVEELTKSTEALTEQVNSLRLENAFLTANKHSWHDPEDALDVARRKGYLEDAVDEETGEVDKKALMKALDRLASEKKYLVDTGSKDDGDDDEPGEPSGEPAGRRSDNSKDTRAKKQQLQKRFPILNR